MEVVALGEAMLRLSAPGRGRLEQAAALELHVGGAEANVAAALARLGVATAWLSALPANPLGRIVAAELARAGVDVDGIRYVEGARVGLYFVEHGSAPRSTSVWYDRAGSAFASCDELDLGALAGARYAVLSGITPALGQPSRRLAARFAAAAREQGAALCLDVNHRARLWTPEQAREGLAPLLAAAEVVVCAERDAQAVLGVEGSGEDALAGLHERWAPQAGLVVLTRSERGAVARHGTRTLHVPAVATAVVDRFGAGDGFLAGLLYGLLRHDVETALRWGAALGALACTVPGDHALFGPDEVEAVLRAPGTALVR